MAITTITMPNLGQTIAELTLLAWLKKAGDRVERGETLVEVETDKTTVPVEAYVSGVLRRILQPAGSVVAAGEPIAVISSTADEPLAEEPKATPAACAAVPTPQADQRPEPVNARQVLATPAAERLSQERGINLASVVGSGPGGRVLVNDVESHLSEAAQAGQAVRVEPLVASEVVELSPMRRATVARMVQSVREAPQFALSVDVDMTEIERRRLSAATAGHKPSFTAYIVHAVATALRQHPQLNARYECDRLQRFRDIHIGLAVATPRGLLAPVIRDADRRTVEEIDSFIEELERKARQGRLLPEALRGATFTISNLGSHGIDRFTAILNPPQAGILAVGRIALRPISTEDRIESRLTATLTLTCDHRAIDGAEAAVFLGAVRAALEEATT
ncbi:MAG TPA: dihydrolipoamide acetyltransferase family protein [Gemmataceae bacterium]|nr:dihydrolipoamide acetyltransferase family protein [Gemmataceae bacterium]